MRIRRLGRWRLPLPVLLATGVTMVAALVAMYFILAWLGGQRELRHQQDEDRAVARLLAAQVALDPGGTVVQSSEHLLINENMHAVIRAGGRTTVLGATIPPKTRVATARVAVPGGGSVSITSDIDSAPDPPLLVVLITTGALLLVLAAALTTNVVITRETRRRVNVASAAADRIAAGDFTARIGNEGPDPLSSLGLAFDSMAARLEQVDADQRQLLSDLAHEIATPIHALAGYAKAVLDGTISGANAKNAINGQAARLSELLNALAQLRALDAATECRPERVELRDLAEATLMELIPLAAHVRLRRHLTSAVVVTDPERVRTILRNLLTNAFRFAPPEGTVEISTGRSGERAWIAVRDTGPGIAPEHHARIFDRFYRAETSRDRTHGGSGLGLAIARRAADTIGARIELDSVPGRGSEFRLVLPLTWLGADHDSQPAPRPRAGQQSDPSWPIGQRWADADR